MPLPQGRSLSTRRSAGARSSHADEHQQLNVSGGCLYGVFADLVFELDGLTEEIGFLHFAMTERLIVTGRRRSLSAVNVTRKLAPQRSARFPRRRLFWKCSSDAWSIRSTASPTTPPAKLDRIEENILADDMSEGRRCSGASAAPPCGCIGSS